MYTHYSNEHIDRDTPLSLHYLFIDTETTGVPYNNYSDWSQCRLIQLGMLVKNNHQETVYENCLTVQFDGTNGTTEEGYNVHGISDNDRVNSTPSQVVCTEFINLALRCDLLISHGNAFDFGVIFRECLLHNIDISCLIGKIVVNTKQSEHYRGYRENLSETIQRINPNWVYNSNYGENRTHNALYDAHLCSELYFHSHFPGMNRPMQDLIEYLNASRYYNGLEDIRSQLRILEEQNNTNREEYVRQMDEILNDYSEIDRYEEEDIMVSDEEDTSDFTWEEQTFEEEDVEEDYYENPEDIDYAYQYEQTTSDDVTIEDFIMRSVLQDRTVRHHEPEDYA
jgi:DNA polymerase III epsilon subunit-like protein